MKTPTYGLIGRGRAARHLGRYLELENRTVLRWNRDDSQSPERRLADADVVVLAISDDALEPFLDRHPSLRRKTTVHLSGSLSIEGVTGLHPLMSFGPDLYDLETYRSMTFVGEFGGPGFYEVFPGLPNPFHRIDPRDKALYHALCVLAGNGSTLLWTRAFETFERRLGLPRAALLPYLERIAANVAAAGGNALTGPLARGDAETVRRDLEALEGDPYQPVFRSFAGLFSMTEAVR